MFGLGEVLNFPRRSLTNNMWKSCRGVFCVPAKYPMLLMKSVVPKMLTTTELLANIAPATRNNGASLALMIIQGLRMGPCPRRHPMLRVGIKLHLGQPGI